MIAAALGIVALNALAQRPKGLAIDTTELGARLRHLSSDQFQGRFPGTRGESLTTGYLIGELQSFGVRPGVNGQWLQPVTIATHRPTPDASPEIRLSGRLTRDLQHGRDVRLANYSTGPTVSAVGEIVFVGYGVHAPTYGWDDFAGMDLRGKVAVALLGEPAIADDTTRFNSGRASRFSRTTDKVEEMERRGALGVLWLRPAGSLSRAPATGPSRLTSDIVPKGVVFTGNIADDVVASLLPPGSPSLKELLARAARPGFRALPLDVRWTSAFARRRRQSPAITSWASFLARTRHWPTNT